MLGFSLQKYWQSYWNFCWEKTKELKRFFAAQETTFKLRYDLKTEQFFFLSVCEQSVSSFIRNGPDAIDSMPTACFQNTQVP